ncbi:MAG: phosphatase PAP2 family protein [Clostridium sp.]
MTKFRWDEIPYPGEAFGPKGEGEDGGSWPLKFFTRGENGDFFDSLGNKVAFEIETPRDTMDFRGKQVNSLRKAYNTLTEDQKALATYWDSENVILLHFKNVITLLRTYKASAMDTARILSIMGDGFNDAMAIAFYYKYKFQIPRGVQLDPELKTFLKTSYDPSYPVGHGVISGMAEIVLSFFFPGEAEKLKKIALYASLSRVYGGIHYPIDVEQGLRLGRHIGRVIIESIKNESSEYGNSINNIYTEYKDAKISPFGE